MKKHRISIAVTFVLLLSILASGAFAASIPHTSHFQAKEWIDNLTFDSEIPANVRIDIVMRSIHRPAICEATGKLHTMNALYNRGVSVFCHYNSDNSSTCLAYRLDYIECNDCGEWESLAEEPVMLDHTIHSTECANYPTPINGSMVVRYWDEPLRQ